jgi:hypothetical protein
MVSHVSGCIRRVAAASLSLAALVLGGCLERFETITIDESGRVALTSVFRGDPADVTEGDALPAEGGPWKVSDTRDTDKDNNPRLTRTATLTVEPGMALPDSYAPAGTLAYETGLRFPTTLRVERRDGADYYHFRRTYVGRPDARYTWIRRSLDERPEYRALKAKDPATLTNDERARLVDAFKMIEIDKQLQFVDAGIAAIPDRPQDVGLAIREAVRAFGRSYESRAIVDLLSQPESAERDASIEAIARSFLGGARKAVERALAESPLTPAERRAFLDAFDVEAARRAVTEDLADERWEVRVEMPGTIVASNADQVEKGTTAVWAFPAGAIMDRDQVLMVTSRVSKFDR